MFDKTRSGTFKVPSKNDRGFDIHEKRPSAEKYRQQENIIERIEENLKDEAGNKWYKFNFECNHLQQYQAEFKFIKYSYSNFNDIERGPFGFISSFACRYLNRSLLE